MRMASTDNPHMGLWESGKKAEFKFKYSGTGIIVLSQEAELTSAFLRETGKSLWKNWMGKKGKSCIKYQEVGYLKKQGNSYL